MVDQEKNGNSSADALAFESIESELLKKYSSKTKTNTSSSKECVDKMVIENEVLKCWVDSFKKNFLLLMPLDVSRYRYIDYKEDLPNPFKIYYQNSLDELGKFLRDKSNPVSPQFNNLIFYYYTLKNRTKNLCIFSSAEGALRYFEDRLDLECREWINEVDELGETEKLEVLERITMLEGPGWQEELEMATNFDLLKLDTIKVLEGSNRLEELEVLKEHGELKVLRSQKIPRVFQKKITEIEENKDKSNWDASEKAVFLFRSKASAFCREIDLLYKFIKDIEYIPFLLDATTTKQQKLLPALLTTYMVNPNKLRILSHKRKTLERFFYDKNGDVFANGNESRDKTRYIPKLASIFRMEEGEYEKNTDCEAEDKNQDCSQSSSTQTSAIKPLFLELSFNGPCGSETVLAVFCLWVNCLIRILRRKSSLSDKETWELLENKIDWKECIIALNSKTKCFEIPKVSARFQNIDLGDKNSIIKFIAYCGQLPIRLKF